GRAAGALLLEDQGAVAGEEGPGACAREQERDRERGAVHPRRIRRAGRSSTARSHVHYWGMLSRKSAAVLFLLLASAATACAQGLTATGAQGSGWPDDAS